MGNLNVYPKKDHQFKIEQKSVCKKERIIFKEITEEERQRYRVQVYNYLM